MKENKDDRLINKLNLILEFNESSPVFSRLAEYEISKDNIENAISLLEKGLDYHPNYPTAHILYGIALIKQGSVDKGLDEISKGTRLIGSDESLNYYLNIIERFLPQNSPPKDEKELGQTDVGSEDDEVFDLNENNFEERILGHDHIISETLAEIYLSQDNLFEALAMFSKLAKTNPKKKDYFLKKAEEVRGLISKKKK